MLTSCQIRGPGDLDLWGENGATMQMPLVHVQYLAPNIDAGMRARYSSLHRELPGQLPKYCMLNSPALRGAFGESINHLHF